MWLATGNIWCHKWLKMFPGVFYTERKAYEETPGVSCVPVTDVLYMVHGSGGDHTDQWESPSSICAELYRRTFECCCLRGDTAIPGYRSFSFCLSETCLSDRRIRKNSHKKSKSIFKIE